MSAGQPQPPAARMCACVRQIVFSQAVGPETMIQKKEEEEEATASGRESQGQKGRISHYQVERCATHICTQTSPSMFTSFQWALHSTIS